MLGRIPYFGQKSAPIDDTAHVSYDKAANSLFVTDGILHYSTLTVSLIFLSWLCLHVFLLSVLARRVVVPMVAMMMVVLPTIPLFLG